MNQDYKKMMNKKTFQNSISLLKVFKLRYNKKTDL